VHRSCSTFAALALAGSVLFFGRAADAAPHVVDLTVLGPGSGSGLVFADAMQQASPWLAADGAPLALDAESNLLELAPGRSAERIVFASENYPAGDYRLGWTGRRRVAARRRSERADRARPSE
jgi:hypothetical protein